eukprot:52405_1
MSQPREDRDNIAVDRNEEEQKYDVGGAPMPGRPPPPGGPDQSTLEWGNGAEDGDTGGPRDMAAGAMAGFREVIPAIRDRSCNDRLWAVAFIVSMIVAIVLAFIQISKAFTDDKSKLDFPEYGVVMMFAFLISEMFVLTVMFVPASAFKFLLPLAGFGTPMFAIYSFFQGSKAGGWLGYILGFELLLFTCLQWLHLVAARSWTNGLWIPIYEVASTLVEKNLSYSPFVLILLTIQFPISSIFVMGAEQAFFQDSYLGTFTLLVIMVVGYWACQVVQNIIHMVISGIIIANFTKRRKVDHSTKNSIKRALSTSFGSLARAALLTDFVQGFAWFAQIAPNFMKSQTFEKIQSSMNVYGLALVTRYGCPFAEASDKAWKAFKLMPNFLKVYEEDCTLTVQIHLSWLGSMLTTSFALVMLPYLGQVKKFALSALLRGGATTAAAAKAQAPLIIGQQEKMFWIAASLIVGYMLCSIAITVVRASITTMFIMIVQSPDEMCEAHPEIHAKIKYVWNRKFGNDAWERLVARSAAAERAARQVAV